MKKITTLLLVLALSMSMLAGCAQNASPNAETTKTTDPAAQTTAPAVQTLAAVDPVDETITPKYVFLFIGDGMSYGCLGGRSAGGHRLRGRTS